MCLAYLISFHKLTEYYIQIIDTYIEEITADNCYMYILEVHGKISAF